MQEDQRAQRYAGSRQLYLCSPNQRQGRWRRRRRRRRGEVDNEMLHSPSHDNSRGVRGERRTRGWRRHVCYRRRNVQHDTPVARDPRQGQGPLLLCGLRVWEGHMDPASGLPFVSRGASAGCGSLPFSPLSFILSLSSSSSSSSSFFLFLVVVAVVVACRALSRRSHLLLECPHSCEPVGEASKSHFFVFSSSSSSSSCPFFLLLVVVAVVVACRALSRRSHLLLECPHSCEPVGEASKSHFFVFFFKFHLFFVVMVVAMACRALSQRSHLLLERQNAREPVDKAIISRFTHLYFGLFLVASSVLCLLRLEET